MYQIYFFQSIWKNQAVEGKEGMLTKVVEWLQINKIVDELEVCCLVFGFFRMGRKLRFLATCFLQFGRVDELKLVSRRAAGLENASTIQNEYNLMWHRNVPVLPQILHALDC
jgi:hypothetical protein